MIAQNTNYTEDVTIKDPAEWTIGEESITGAKEFNFHRLARKAGEEMPDEWTKSEASMEIDELQEKTISDAPKKRKEKKA